MSGGAPDDTSHFAYVRKPETAVINGQEQKVVAGLLESIENERVTYALLILGACSVMLPGPTWVASKNS